MKVLLDTVCGVARKPFYKRTVTMLCGQVIGRQIRAMRRFWL